MSDEKLMMLQNEESEKQYMKRQAQWDKEEQVGRLILHSKRVEKIEKIHAIRVENKLKLHSKRVENM